MCNFRSLRNAVIVATVALLAAGSGVLAARSAKPSTDGLLRAIPAKSLFCVRINKLDGTLGSANEFLGGVAPESFDAKAEVLSMLGELLGNEKLRGVNTKGNFVLFGVNVPGEQATPGPMGNMFIGALMPVRDYEKLISSSSNLGEPDDDGISTITVNGRPEGCAIQVRRFALLCPPWARGNLIRVKKMMGQKRQGLANALDAGEKELAASSPVWLYANVQEGSKLIGPMVFAGLEKMKADLQKMKDSGQGPPMIDPAGIVNFYGGILKMVIGGTDHIMVGLSPTSDMCSLTVCMKPVPGTDMAEIVGSPVAGDFENMLGYLDDGAMMNLAGKIDHKSMKTAYMIMIDLVGQMVTGAMSEADVGQLKNLTTKMINALGDSLAMSFGVDGEGSSMLWIKYVIKVKNEKAFKQVLEQELQMMQEEGALGKLYKGLGMEMDVKVERGAGTYKGIEIDAAKVAFKMGDDDSPQGQMLKKMFGDALDYNWAFVDGYCVYSIGGDADKSIRELIDHVRAGGPKRIGSEMKAALEAIPNSTQADAVGTLNYVRMLNMVSGIMVVPGGPAMPQFSVPTTSNVAFAARTTAEGNVMLQMAVPKKHVLEIKSAFETLIPQIEKQQRELRRQQQEQAEDN
jgi:hypothetical protein